jgi:DNA-binding MarR family transcriptional regulator
MIDFIKLHRDILDWEWYQSSEVSRLYIHLILRANFLSKKWQGYAVNRGQLITSNKHLAIELGMTIQVIRTALKKLESSNYIKRKTTNKFTLITIINYDTKQSAKNISNKQSIPPETIKPQTSSISLTTTKESKKDNKVNKIKIVERKAKFKNLVFEHSQYSTEILSSFFNYWSEMDLKTKTLRFEEVSFFEIENRLKGWLSKERNWNKIANQTTVSKNR